jgi:hypothetical protein
LADDAQGIPGLILGILTAMRPGIEKRILEERTQWLHSQPWYRDLHARAEYGSGALSQASGAQEPGFSAYGSGGVGKGLAEGGGGIRYSMPLGKNSLLTLAGGGGGASGEVSTPIGARKITQFFPDAAIAYRRSF